MMIVWVIDWHFSLETVLVISSLRIKLLKISNPNIIPVVPRICAKVSLYSMCVAEDEKNKCFPDPFLWSIYNKFYASNIGFVTDSVSLFDHVFLIEVIWVW